jgi:hypothetical protein
MKFKFARYTTTTGMPGNPAPIYVEEGDAWDADDPLVKSRPNLFSDVPPMVHSSFGKRANVEQATAAPGETRKR